jgi:hypothetical protein
MFTNGNDTRDAHEKERRSRPAFSSISAASIAAGFGSHEIAMESTALKSLILRRRHFERGRTRRETFA